MSTTDGDGFLPTSGGTEMPIITETPGWFHITYMYIVLKWSLKRLCRAIFLSQKWDNTVIYSECL